jgi:hypothetical protein
LVLDGKYHYHEEIRGAKRQPEAAIQAAIETAIEAAKLGGRRPFRKAKGKRVKKVMGDG